MRISVTELRLAGMVAQVFQQSNLTDIAASWC